MRKGKQYAYLLPTATAPDMPGYGGLPRFATCELALFLGFSVIEFVSGVEDNTVEIIPKTWETKYFGRAKAGVYELDWAFRILPRTDKPGVRVLCGGILQDGSLFLVEKSHVWDFTDPHDFGVCRIAPPFDAQSFDGVITGVRTITIEKVRRKDMPP